MASEIDTTQKTSSIPSSTRTHGEGIPMRKSKMLVVTAATLILFGVGGWVASTTKAHVAPVGSPSILELTMRAGDLPTAHYEDYSLVFPETDGALGCSAEASK